MYNQTSDLVKELSTNFIEYAAAVNTDRAIPDATSGLKPVARRILYGTLDGGHLSNKPHVKCARIVGDVMGVLHPHGDSSIYGALVRLAQDWVMRYPLIDFHGNVGNIAGDGPAHYRYTEARLSKLSEMGLLKGLKKRNVEFTPNYDESTEEPITLPAIFPNLLCNPNTGIGVAMACNWLPHNLTEVANAIFDYMDGREPYIPGPDFPTGGLIINSNDMANCLATGRGSVKLRGQYKIEKNQIVFYEIPYGVNTEDLIREIGTVCDEGQVEGVKDVRDESNKKGLRIVIECRSGENLDVIVNKLFAKTDLQVSICYNQVALVDKTPTELGLKQCIEIYLNHNRKCIVREITFDLSKAQDRLEIVEGLLRALEDIDNIIALIKASASAATAKDALIEKYSFTEPQAKAIVDMKLGRLAGLEKIELNDERAELIAEIANLNAILSSTERQDDIIRTRLKEIVHKFGDVRRTQLTHIEVKPEEKDIETVVPVDCVVVVTKSGMVKRVPTKSFKTQHINGKGIKTTEDTVLDTISTNTIDTLMVFTDAGKMYKVLVDDLPEGTNASKGQSISNYIRAKENEKIVAITSLLRKNEAEYIVFITKNGNIKKTSLSEFEHVKRGTGITAIKLKENDAIVSAVFLNEEDLILITKTGTSIRFETASIMPIGRNTTGVKGIAIKEDDEVIAALPVRNERESIAIFYVNGSAKRMPVTELVLQKRGGKGALLVPRTETVAAAAMVEENDAMLIIGGPNSICVPVSEIPFIGRQHVGNKMLKEGKIITAVKL